MAEVEREVTETRAAQMQLDRTAEECKRVHEQSHNIYGKLVDIVKKQEKKNRELELVGRKLTETTAELNQREEDKRNKREGVLTQQKANKQKETDITIIY